MIRHTSLGSTTYARLRTLAKLVQRETVTLGGHRPGKIYGRLDCRTGKRMKPENRVFFSCEAEAVTFGYRPCAVCLSEDYKAWKRQQ